MTSLSLGDSVDQDGDDSLIKDNPLQAARNIVLRALAIRARTAEELRTLLKKKQVNEQIIEEVLTRFEEVGLVNDADFAAAWVSSRHQRKSLSASALRAELYRKGIAPEIIAEATSSINHDQEYQNAYSFAEKWIARSPHLDHLTAQRRLAAALSRRGYGASIVAEVISQLVLAD